MSLSGNLRTMALPDILQWLSMGRKTGTLHVDHRSVKKKIIFHDGTIYSSWSNDPRESLGQFLLRSRRVTEEHIFKALLRQEKDGRLFGAILVDEGVLGETELLAMLRVKAEETVYELFLWAEGRFEFKDGELPDNLPFSIQMEVTAVIMEGVRRIDEWERIRKVFPSMKTTFVVIRGEDPTEPAEREVLALLAPGKTLTQISLELHRSEFETAALLYDLHARGIVGVDVPGEVTQVLDTVEAILGRLALAEQRLKERRYDQALKAYEEVLALDRINQHAKKGLIAVIEAKNRDRQLKTIPLDKVPYLAVDYATLTRQSFDPLEGFVLSRANGQWDVRSILKLCPMAEEDALLIFARLLERKVIELK